MEFMNMCIVKFNRLQDKHEPKILIYFHCMETSSVNILLNISFCVPQK